MLRFPKALLERSRRGMIDSDPNVDKASPRGFRQGGGMARDRSGEDGERAERDTTSVIMNRSFFLEKINRYSTKRLNPAWWRFCYHPRRFPVVRLFGWALTTNRVHKGTGESKRAYSTIDEVFRRSLPEW
jgi:hypothetical protein